MSNAKKPSKKLYGASKFTREQQQTRLIRSAQTLFAKKGRPVTLAGPKSPEPK